MVVPRNKYPVVLSIPKEFIAECRLEHINVECGVGCPQVLHRNADGVGCFTLYTSLQGNLICNAW